MPPNNYPFYVDEAKYVPVMQADGGQLSGEGWGGRGRGSGVPAPPPPRAATTPLLQRAPSHRHPSRAEWKPMYHPTAEQAEADRNAAYESGTPHGYVAPGDAYAGLPTITLTVVSELVSGVIRQLWAQQLPPCGARTQPALPPAPPISTPRTSTARWWMPRGGTAAGPSRSRSAPRCGWRSCGASSG